MSSSIEIGFNWRMFPANWRSATDEIEFAVRHGFEAIQFQDRGDGFNADHLGDALTTVVERLEATGLTAVMEMIISIDREGRTASGTTPLDWLKTNLPIITTLGCRSVHWHLLPAERMDGNLAREVEQCLVPQLAEAVAIAQQEGVRFAFEHNEPELLLFGSPAGCRMLLDAVPDLYLVWDLNHTAPEHLAEFQALIPRVSMLHVSDTPLPAVNHHLPVGAGAINFASYLRPLHEANFQGPAIFEIGGLPSASGPGHDTDDALVASQRYLREALQRAAGVESERL